MAGALSAVGSTVVDSLPGTVSISKASSGDGRVVPYRKPEGRSGRAFPRAVELGSSFVDCWSDWRVEARVISGTAGHQRPRKQRRDRRFVVMNEVAGQYEDSFEDVKARGYISLLASFMVNNKPGDGKRFLRALGKERHDLAERVMVTRLHLYGKWVKECDHAAIYKEISDENLELMRERLMETVIWPADDTNTEKIG
ncbi:hypothetical protein CDL15_Pgr025370 [Punica granatum]|uniref:Chaperonin-like RbcX protein 2, chloroplastic n=1 Tax=Punica granatum TaxID=22663 RepID=A0A218W9F6_PUNGR|nr:hypothetical protein CDL15_Pgr025370 [Punica granatum]